MKHISLFVQRNFHSLNEGKDENLKELALQNELKVGVLGRLSCASHHLGNRSDLPPSFLGQNCSPTRTERFCIETTFVSIEP